ncbi:MAG TPA: CRISPR-associated endonuclease Cas2 [Candidatus Paceibacterota bacterium]
MGKLEIESKKRARKYAIQKGILTTLVVGGVIVLAGGSLAQALIKSVMSGEWKKKRSDSISRALRRLLDSGYVTFRDTGRGNKLEITNKGRAYLSLVEAGEEDRPKPRKWDRKWRVVIFDIKEERRASRQRLRDFLRRLGFMKLQNSVWVYPYDCEDLVTLIKSEFRIGKGILYLIVDTIEYDKPIREHFGLHTS